VMTDLRDIIESLELLDQSAKWRPTMNDTELAALTMLVRAEIGAMEATNTARTHGGQAVAYQDDSFLSLDCVKCLEAELRNRGVLITPKGK